MYKTGTELLLCFSSLALTSLSYDMTLAVGCGCTALWLIYGTRPLKASSKKHVAHAVHLFLYRTWHPLNMAIQDAGDQRLEHMTSFATVHGGGGAGG